MVAVVVVVPEVLCVVEGVVVIEVVVVNDVVPVVVGVVLLQF